MIHKLIMAVDLSPVVSPVLEVINAILWPLIAIVGAIGPIYCIYLGVRLAKADEQNSREKAKRFSRRNCWVLSHIYTDSITKNSFTNTSGLGFSPGLIKKAKTRYLHVFSILGVSLD